MSPYRRIGTQLTFTDQDKIEGVIKAGLELMSGTCLLESVTPPRS